MMSIDRNTIREQGGRLAGRQYHSIVGNDSTQIVAGDINIFDNNTGSTPEQQCCRAFKTSAYEEYKNRNELRVEGTCQWVLSHTHFQRWRQSEHHDLLWISADPGCGKSVLAKSLVDHDLHDGGRSMVCFFFFKDNEEQDNLASALCAILHQLFTQRPDLTRYALEAWRNNGDKIQRETQEMWQILQRLADDPMVPPIVCVLDALDECREHDRQQLISLLCGVVRSATSRPTTTPLKFLVTSRPYDSVQRWFEETTSQWPRIRLRGEDENEQVQREINLVIDQHIEKLGAEFFLSPASRDRLRSALVQMQHRTYLWLYLAIDEIRETFHNSLDPDSVTIERLPQSVEMAYERLLQRVKPKQHANARQVLLVIVGARRPLTVGEMTWALGSAQAERAQSRQIKPLNVQHLEKQIRLWCGLFVYIQHSMLFLIHQTAKEFLLLRGLETVPRPEIWQGSFDSQQIELQMLKICTVFLHSAPGSLQEYGSDQHLPDGGDMDSHDHQLPTTDHHVRFFQYCAEYWPGHLQDDIRSADGSLLDRVLALYDDRSSLFSTWFHHFWKASSPYPHTPKMPRQHVIALNGHHRILAHIYREHPFDLEAKDSTGSTALFWAAERGHINMTKWLIDKGSDVNARGEYNETVLQAASRGGHTEIVQIMLNKGANNYNEALGEASFRGHTQIVQMMLDKGADDYNGALREASLSGHTQIIQIMLDKGADDYNGALREASLSGHTQIIQIMLDKGADDYNGALREASSGGHTQIVQMMFDKGADDYNGALQLASLSGHTQIVQIMLDKGADDYNGALQLASGNGHTQIVQMMLDKGANDYNGALQWTSGNGRTQIVQLLRNKRGSLSP